MELFRRHLETVPRIWGYVNRKDNQRQILAYTFVVRMLKATCPSTQSMNQTATGVVAQKEYQQDRQQCTSLRRKEIAEPELSLLEGQWKNQKLGLLDLERNLQLPSHQPKGFRMQEDQYLKSIII